MKLIWTSGCFDILHAGHVDYLTKASELGILMVGVSSNKSMKAQNRKRVMDEKDRKKIIEAIKGVDAVIIEDITVESLKILKPDIYVKAGDYNIETINQEERKIIESYGGEIKFIPVVHNIHSSQLK